MKNSTLKQIIKEEVRSALNEAESSELAKMAKEIKMENAVTVDEVVEQYTFLRTEDVEKMSDAERRE
jgi:Mg/Co/Ni transporter MgtE